MPSTLEAYHSSALCRSCGLCCDGTLYGRVPLTEDDAATLATGQVQAQRESQLAQPCPHHGGGGCAVYLRRPVVCTRFSCKTLRRYQETQLSYRQAHEIIAKTVRLADRVRSRLHWELSVDAGPLPALYTAWEQAQPDARTAAWAERNHTFLVDYGALLWQLKRHFRPERKAPSGEAEPSSGPRTRGAI